MKQLLSLCALLACGEFAFAYQDAPQHVRVSVQYFSLPLGTLNELFADETSGDAVLHEKIMALSKERKAELIDSNMVVCRSGQKATIESIREEIYPTEYEPPGLPIPTDQLPLIPHTANHFRPILSTPTAFETRNTGTTLEVEATYESPFLVSLRMVPEKVMHNGLITLSEHTDYWGKADIRMPVFETWRANTTMILKPGTYALVSSIKPKRALPVPFLENRILLFVRADLLGTALE
jgi:hypothetical protein